MLVLTRAEVESLLDLDRLVDAVSAALTDLTAGRASMPPRVAAMVAEPSGMLAAMPAFLPSAHGLTTKLVSVFPENRDRPSHQALILCFDPEDGTPVALMDGTYITAARTAAVSALATRLLARAGASTVVVIGTGVQARSHATALARHPGIGRLVVAGRDRAAAEALVSELGGRLAVPIEVASSIESAVSGADVVCAATHAADPVLRREWLRPGTHVNSVGFNSTGRGEVDGATIRDARVVVESRDATLAPPPAGAVELRLALEERLTTRERITEIGEVVTGAAPGRTDPEQLTLYKGVGVAVEDAAAATLVLEAARQAGIGTVLDI